MKKAQLETKIIELHDEIRFYHDVIDKLLRDYVHIKPVPKGTIKERIAVFTEPVTAKKITTHAMFFLKPLDMKNQDSLTFK